MNWCKAKNFSTKLGFKFKQNSLSPGWRCDIYSCVCKWPTYVVAKVLTWHKVLTFLLCQHLPPRAAAAQALCYLNGPLIVLFSSEPGILKNKTKKKQHTTHKATNLSFLSFTEAYRSSLFAFRLTQDINYVSHYPLGFTCCCFSGCLPLSIRAGDRLWNVSMQAQRHTCTFLHIRTEWSVEASILPSPYKPLTASEV